MVEIKGNTPIWTPVPPVNTPPATPSSPMPAQAVPAPPTTETVEMPTLDIFVEAGPETPPPAPAEPATAPATLPLQAVRKLDAEGLPPRPAGGSMRAEMLQSALQQSLSAGVMDPGLALSLAVEARGIVSQISPSSAAAAPLNLPTLAQVQEKLADLSVAEGGDSKAPRLFTSLEAAIEAANQNNSGNEALVEVMGEDGNRAYALVELKSSTPPAQLSETLGSPRGSLYSTNGNGVLQSHPPATETPQALFGRVQELAQVAIQDKARGFDLNRAGTQEADRTPAYLANLSTALAEVSTAQTTLLSEKTSLDAELKALGQAGKGSSPEAEKLKTRLGELGSQLSQLETAKTILDARLSQLPPAQALIPGSERKVGSDRAHPERIQARLQSASDLLHTHLAQAKTPEERSQLEGQIQAIASEMEGVSQRNMQIQAAALHTHIRLGSLATIHKALDSAHSSLETDLQKLADLEAKMPSLKGTELESTQAAITLLHQQIDADRKALIGIMEKEIGVYKDHANTRQKGAQDAVSLLELQVAKLNAVDSKTPATLLATIAETQTILLDSVKKAGDKFVGITPEEATALAGISSKTDGYISDYRRALSQLADLKADVTRKAGLLDTPPVSAIGNSQLGALDQAYLARIQTALKEAPEGSKLEQLKKLYVALEMSKSDQVDEDLRARVDTDKIQRKIAELSQDPEVQKAFETARQQAVKDVFGEVDPSIELAELLLSPEFEEYLGLLPEAEQTQVLQSELTKLMALNPAKGKEVQETLVARKLQAKAGEIIKGTSLEERKAVFEQLLGFVSAEATGADKKAKVADGFAKAFEALSPAEMQKMQEYLTLMNRNPNASEKLYQLLSDKLTGLGPSGASALEDLGKLHSSGKIGAFLTLVAGVATTGKVPDAVSKGDFKSLTDLTSSAFSVASGAPGVLKMYGVSVEKGMQVAEAMMEAGDLAGGMSKMGHMATAAKAVKVLEVLGPIGDTLGAGLDAYGSYQDFSSGDTVGGYAKATGAGAGAVGAVAGVAILAGATGPGAPIVLAGATVVGLVAWGIDAGWGESEEETFLRQLDVLKPEVVKPSRVLTPDFEGDPGLGRGGVREI
ncbi:MAG: hypothetical protein IV090_07875 [Candidatus Sericytochromatia bacterium]|nr:hypothetical protein [Candidatus Sericytochromatia bacterium]